MPAGLERVMRAMTIALFISLAAACGAKRAGTGAASAPQAGATQRTGAAVPNPPLPAAKPAQQKERWLSNEEVAAAVAAIPEAAALWPLALEAETKYRQDPSDQNKQAVIKTRLEFAEEVMFLFMTPIAPNRQYLVPYQSYQRILQLDPKHAAARSRTMTIVNIYVSWNRALPEGAPPPDF